MLSTRTSEGRAHAAPTELAADDVRPNRLAFLESRRVCIQRRKHCAMGVEGPEFFIEVRGAFFKVTPPHLVNAIAHLLVVHRHGASES